MIWEFDSSVKTRNYAINKGDPGNINHFNINNIFLAFHNKWIPSYQEHLTKLFSNFVSELHKINHVYIMCEKEDRVSAYRMLNFRDALINIKK